MQTIRKFTDRNGYTTCSEVITSFDQFCCFRVTEQSLQFSFFRCITLLNFCTIFGQRFNVVGLGGTCCATASISSGSAAKQNDNISWLWNFTDNIFTRCCCNDASDFHSLGYIAWMVDFCDMTSCKADLVTIGGITLGSCCDNLGLRKLSFQCFFHRCQRICSTCYTHCLIDIGTSG